MLQALTLFFFAAAALGAAAIIALIVAEDWKAVRAALGLDQGRLAALPIPVRAKPARRAMMVRVKLPPAPRRAAA